MASRRDLADVGSFFVTQNFPILFGETRYLARIGVQYQLHAGSVTIAPTGWVEITE